MSCYLKGHEEFTTSLKIFNISLEGYSQNNAETKFPAFWVWPEAR